MKFDFKVIDRQQTIFISITCMYHTFILSEIAELIDKHTLTIHEFTTDMIFFVNSLKTYT